MVLVQRLACSGIFLWLVDRRAGALPLPASEVDPACGGKGRAPALRDGSTASTDEGGRNGMKRRSSAVTEGVARAPHRSLLKADGITDVC